MGGGERGGDEGLGDVGAEADEKATETGGEEAGDGDAAVGACWE